MRKRSHIRGFVRALLVLPVAVAGGCSKDTFAPDAGWFSKPIELTSRPSWLFYSDGREASKTRAVGPDELVSADGNCAAKEPEAAAVSPDNQPNAAREGLTSPPPALGPSGVGLDMTECEVIRRAGHTSAIQVGNNERGDRTVVMTYTSGPSPGIYRFTAGRLTSIERVAEPEQPKPKRPARPQQNRART